MIMLKNVRLIDPASRTDQTCDILIAEEKIIRIGEALELDARLIARAKGEVLTILDCSGLCAAPGFVDSHVHFRDPGFTYKEDVMSGSAAAAAGGFTSVICMANTNPVVDNEETIVDLIRKDRNAPIHVYNCSAVTKGLEGKELVDMRLMKECGAVGFTDDGHPLLDAELVKTAMLTARRLKLPLSFHEEDPQYIAEPGINHGPVAEKMGLTGADRKAETTLVERDCRLAQQTGATVVIQHISAKESVDLVRAAQKSGARVWAEATPHHFSLTEEAVQLYGTSAKVNPPVRLEEDRQAIIRGLQDGTINVIATDHAPHAKAEKDRPFTEAPSGMTGLETSFALGVMNLVQPGYLTLPQLVERMSMQPARLYGLEAGFIREDGPADLVLFDPNLRWTYLVPQSKSTNSPWLGKSLVGKVLLTICSGKIVFEDSRSLAGRRLSGDRKMKFEESGI